MWFRRDFRYSVQIWVTLLTKTCTSTTLCSPNLNAFTTESNLHNASGHIACRAMHTTSSFAFWLLNQRDHFYTSSTEQPLQENCLINWSPAFAVYYNWLYSLPLECLGMLTQHKSRPYVTWSGPSPSGWVSRARLTNKVLTCHLTHAVCIFITTRGLSMSEYRSTFLCLTFPESHSQCIAYLLGHTNTF